jgi:hypothetical protein
MTFIKGQKAWNKGLKTPDEIKLKLRGPRFDTQDEKAHQWRGEEASYGCKHRWVYKHLGKANHCDNSDCIYPRKNSRGILLISPKRYEWSNISGEYKRVISDWQQLCVSCHQIYDYHR